MLKSIGIKWYIGFKWDRLPWNTFASFSEKFVISFSVSLPQEIQDLFYNFLLLLKVRISYLSLNVGLSLFPIMGKNLNHITLAPWCSGYHYGTTSFNKSWTQVLPRLNSCLRLVGDLRWWESLRVVPAGNKAKRLSSVNHYIKTIHHHHPHIKTF